LNELRNGLFGWISFCVLATALTPGAWAQFSTAPLSTQPDLIAALIDQAEKEYQAGQTNYQTGHLVAARLNFDNAFNLLLESPYDIHADERLQREFDRIVNGASGLELAALEQGDGFTQQKSEPAPIDEANEVTFPVDPNVKAQAEAEIRSTRSDLPLMLTDPVVSFLNYFSKNGKGTLERGLIRAGRYEPMIRRVLKEEGVPQDLIYLAQAESGFHELALSRAGARGMWQFISSRATGYGLARNWWLDERLDPEKSTRAAARHLHDLYNQFGDWYLAMAAYNSGPGNVQQAVRRTGYADFWELYNRNVLPRETKNYVPIIVAVAIMAKNKAQYGLESIVPDPPALFDTVKIAYPVDLRLVAECVDAPVASLQDLNPSLLRTTTPKDTEFDLHLPVGSKERYQTAIAAIPEEVRVWWRYHRVGPGETMASLSRTYRTPVASIVEANGLASDEVEPDVKLIIPIAEGKVVAGETGDLYSKHAMRYRTRRGDTVASIAQNFGVPADKVRYWNHLRGNTLHSGRTVRIYLPLVAGRESEAWTGGTTSKHQKRRHAQTAKAKTAKTKTAKANTKSKPVAKSTHAASSPSVASKHSASQSQAR
jgi:membrane-bound lytic murein transglycosylase D